MGQSMRGSVKTSPSSRGRGLKSQNELELSQVVATSPSSRGRGLKFLFLELYNLKFASPSSRGRGLKSKSPALSGIMAGRPLHEGVD